MLCIGLSATGMTMPKSAPAVTATQLSNGAIDAMWKKMGAQYAYFGNATSAETAAVNGGSWKNFEHGAILWSPRTGAQISVGEIRNLYASQGYENGKLGYPSSAIIVTGESNLRQTYEGGEITWTPTTGGKITYSSSSIDNSPAGAKAYTKTYITQFGWDATQYQCLVTLWEHESNWNYQADNPWSDAYSIPQALPGNKMATAGSDWETNSQTQIKWGVGYIKDRYGSPCGALNAWNKQGWY